MQTLLFALQVSLHGPQALLPAELHALARDLHVPPPPGDGNYTSRHADFYKLPVEQRRAVIAGSAGLSEAGRCHLTTGELPMPVADRMTENVIGTFALPLSVGLNVRVNGRDHLVPMVVEEPSVVAAVSNAARMVRASGGFRGDATASVMTAQVQLDRVAHPVQAAAQLTARRDEILATANAAIPRMVERGGGCVDLDVRVLDVEEGLLVIHLYVDVGDAMGANLVDTVAERVAPAVQGWVGGSVGLRILSNLPLRRVVHVECEVSADAVGGDELADGIARASRFAEMDPFRAVTHNKGVMNGIDAVALALGQDWRAIEAGAHSYAAIGSQYRPVAVWHRTETGLRGEIETVQGRGRWRGARRRADLVAADPERLAPFIGVDAEHLAQTPASRRDEWLCAIGARPRAVDDTAPYAADEDAPVARRRQALGEHPHARQADLRGRYRRSGRRCRPGV